MMTEIDTIAYFSIGFTNITNNFIVKYHENHSYDNCRLIKVNENSSIELWKETLIMLLMLVFFLFISFKKFSIRLK